MLVSTGEYTLPRRKAIVGTGGVGEYGGEVEHIHYLYVYMHYLSFLYRDGCF